MDTDDLSEKAYSIIVHAATVCDTLKAELGALSWKCEAEVTWLSGVQNLLKKIVEDPDEYVDYWNLEEEEGIDVRKWREMGSGLSNILKT